MRPIRLLSILILASLVVAPVFGTPQVDATRSADLAVTAQALRTGGSLTLSGVVLDGDASRDFQLERFEVFTRDAQIAVNRETGREILPAPNNVYLRGSVIGDPASGVMLTVLADGTPRGLLQMGPTLYVLGAEDSGRIIGRTVDPASFEEDTSKFSCGADALDHHHDHDHGHSALSDLLPALSPKPATPASIPEGVTHTARIAIETDNEFLNNLFGGDTTAATDYVGDLIAFTSTIYEAEVSTNFLITHIELWSSTDPWGQFGTTCGLMEFGKYWNDNNGGIERSLTHFMSGKQNGGGVAWVGVLCSGAFNFTLSNAGISCPPLPNTSNYGGAYGYSGDLDGNFTIGNPSVVWDIVVVAHEIGHNFNSPHTHCYSNLGGNSNPVDNCFAGQCGQTGCYCGPTSLPGPAGQGSGTIMSYCHLTSPGISNISLNLGTGHPFGTEPERVPERMTAHVLANASSNPACLAFVPPLEEIFTDGYESGDTSAWSSTVN